MQFSVTLIFALAVTTAYALPLSEGSNEDRVKTLISAVSDFITARSAKFTPRELPDLVDCDTSQIVPIVAAYIRAMLTLTDNVYYGLDELDIGNVKTNPEKFSAQMEFTFKTLGLKGKYQVDGEVLGYNATGAGNYENVLSNVTISLTNIQLYETENKALRVESLGALVNFGGYKFVIDGINLDGLTTPEFELLVDNGLTYFITGIKDDSVASLEYQYIPKINKAIGNLTLEEVVEWLKEHKDDELSLHEDFFKHLMFSLNNHLNKHV